MFLLLTAPAALAEEPVVTSPPAKALQNLPAIVVTTGRDAQADRQGRRHRHGESGGRGLYPAAGGWPAIRSLNADVGDKVEANSTLATLNDDALVLQKSQMEATKAKGQATLAQLRAQLTEAHANAEEAGIAARPRRRDGFAKGTVSTSSVEQANAAAAANKARVASAEQAIAVAEADLKVIDSQIADTDLKLARTGVKNARRRHRRLA